MVPATTPQIDHLAAHVVAAAPETRLPARNHLIAALGRMVPGPSILTGRGSARAPIRIP